MKDLAIFMLCSWFFKQLPGSSTLVSRGNLCLLSLQYFCVRLTVEGLLLVLEICLKYLMGNTNLWYEENELQFFFSFFKLFFFFFILLRFVGSYLSGMLLIGRSGPDVSLRMSPSNKVQAVSMSRTNSSPGFESSIDRPMRLAEIFVASEHALRQTISNPNLLKSLSSVEEFEVY